MAIARATQEPKCQNQARTTQSRPSLHSEVGTLACAITATHAISACMSEHRATVRWKRESSDFEYKHYNREHEWKFEHGFVVGASAAPDYLGKPGHVDPEEAFVASISSCHMLTFLAIASKRKFVVENYTDDAVGFLEKTPQSRMAISRVELRPNIVFSGEPPTPAQIEKMHESAHRNCFIANSVTARIDVLPSSTGASSDGGGA